MPGMNKDNALLPVGRRPRCRACGRELRPNFRVERVGEKIVKRYTRRDYDGRTREVTASDRNAEQDAKGRWYVERKVAVEERTFLGHYGAYRDSKFCGLNCGYQWAVSISAHLDAKGERLVTYDQASTPTPSKKEKMT